MKSSFLSIKKLIAATAALAVIWACEKSLERDGTELDTLVPTKVDADAGTWKPYILQTATEVALTAPEDVSSANYQKELQEVKTAMGNISDDQRLAIRYWAGGGICAGIRLCVVWWQNVTFLLPKMPQVNIRFRIRQT
jgi:hypothetical protein